MPTDLIDKGGEPQGGRALREPALVSDQAPAGLDPAGIDPAREVFGIECEHHYGITTHPLPQHGDAAREVYRLIREAWHAPRGGGGGLSNDNHTWIVTVAPQPGHWSSIDIAKNERSPLFAWRPSWVSDGPGAHWFSQKFRVATRAVIEADVADRLAWAAKWQAETEAQRDTIRGRKARAKYASLAETARREAKFIRSRWPEFDGMLREDWQARMHRHLDPARDRDGAEGGDANAAPVPQDRQARADRHRPASVATPTRTIHEDPTNGR